MKALAGDRRILVLLSTLIASVLVAVVVSWFYWQAQKQHERLDEKSQVLTENIGRLRVLDETLTMSVRIVASAEPEYEDEYEARYDKAATEFTELVEETLNLFPESEARQQFKATDEPADRLFELEKRSFELAREGRDSEAFALLESPEYERYKQEYAEGLDSTFTALKDTQARAQQRIEAYELALLGVGALGLILALLGWTFAIRTLVERREAEKASFLLASIVENSRDAIDSKTPDGIILSVNPSAEQLYGYSEEEIKGKDVSIFTPPEHLDEMKEILKRVGQGETIAGYETERVSKDGRRIPLSLTISPVRNSANEIVGVSAIARDITERKLVEEELRRAKEIAEAATRAKSNFLATMSHEIRTPMNGVIGMTGLLLDTNLSDEQREYAETVRASGENLLSLINDILDFSKIEAGKMELEIVDFDLSMVVEQALGLFAERAQAKDLELANLVGNDVPTALRGDPGRLTQILTNLLGNAIKFTQEGEVVLRVVLLQENEASALVRFCVTDTGIGMNEEQRSALFKFFSQADASTTRRYGGTGLGLAISKQLVELMGGEIGVESEPGAGSTFFFEVPFAKNPEGARIAAPPYTDLRGLRVLVVDDNDTNREIVHHQVTSWGMENGMARDGPQALERLRSAAESGEPYDLAIIDMQMPDMDGMQLARRIKAAGPAVAATRLIMLTSLGRWVDAEEAQRVGIDAYLTKPVRQSKLYDAIAAVMGAPAETTSEEAQPVTLDGKTKETAPSGARVLVAEDNSVNQKVAVRMLERLGYRADVAANGLEALEMLSYIPYAAVLMDVQMPEMDGYAATAEIRKREGAARHTPIIAMTANALEGDREKALEAGMDDYLSKPVKPEELGKVLARWISQEETVEITMPRSGGSASPTETGAPLDPAVIENLRELGGSEMLTELAQMYFDDASSSLRGLREAVEGGDGRAVERTAHALKGSSGNMGAKGIAEICAELEAVGASGDLSRAPELLVRLEKEFGRVRPVLEAETANGPYPQ